MSTTCIYVYQVWLHQDINQVITENKEGQSRGLSCWDSAKKPQIRYWEWCTCLVELFGNLLALSTLTWKHRCGHCGIISWISEFCQLGCILMFFILCVTTVIFLKCQCKFKQNAFNTRLCTPTELLHRSLSKHRPYHPLLLLPPCCLLQDPNSRKTPSLDKGREEQFKRFKSQNLPDYKSMNPRQDATSVLGEGELAVILLCLSLHLVLSLPAFIICVSRVFKVNVPQVISQIIWQWDRKKVNEDGRWSVNFVKTNSSCQKQAWQVCCG